MANSNSAVPLKVVLIEYHHIHTDVSNFKSVVQTLTGMHSTAVDGGGETRKRRRVEEISTEICRNSTTSFKDLDRLLKLDLPSMEDLNWIWAD